MRIFRLLVNGVLAAAALMSPGLSVAAPASAGSGGLQSRNFSGYAVSGAPGSVTHVAGSWEVPGATCGRSKDGYALFWVGIDGLDLSGTHPGSTGEGVGTEFECSNGIASYYAWYQLAGGATIIPLPVKPGDEVSAAVDYSGGQFTVKITNERTGESFSTSAEMSQAQRATAEWLVGAPINRSGVVERLAHFGTALHGYNRTGLGNTSEATIGGERGPAGKFAAIPVTMVDSKGAKLAAPSPLSADGTSFSVTSTAQPATPNFVIVHAPSSAQITPGQSATFTISAASSGGFDAAIALSATGQPSGSTVTFDPASIPAPGIGSSSMTISTSSSTPTGTYIIVVTGAGGGLTATTNVALTVANSTIPIFAITSSPKSVKVTPGSSTPFTISTMISSTFNSAIVLSASGQPAGVMVSFNPSSIPAPGAGSSTMTVNVGTSTALGAYIITIQGTGGGVTETTQVSIAVVKTTTPFFTIKASPNTVKIAQGSSGTVTISTAAFNGFNSAIALSAAGQPTGATVAFNPATIPAPGTGSSAMTIDVASSLATGTYIISVSGTGGGVSNRAFVFLTVTH